LNNPTYNSTSGAGSLLDFNNASAIWYLSGAWRNKSNTFPDFTKLQGDVGSAFRLIKTESQYSLKDVNFVYSSGSSRNRGSGLLVPVGGAYLNEYPANITPLDDLALNSFGTKAIANCIPTNPLADAATFVGELRQVPKVPGSSFAKKGPKGVGGEYLNIEFGWNPILRDAKSFREANAKADAYLQQLAAKSGQQVKRRYTLRDEVTQGPVEVLNANQLSSFSGSLANPYRSFPLYRTLKTQTTVWFSGSFSYYYALSPSESAYLTKVRKAKDVFGLDLSLELAWNLMPYSWLSDWTFNIGNIAHNLTRFSQDGLTMKYGYIMAQTSRTYEYSYGPSSWSLTKVIKQRKAASPFGFGVAPANLTDRQWAILAALGQSKFWK
jgi:hypothetical protein